MSCYSLLLWDDMSSIYTDCRTPAIMGLTWAWHFITSPLMFIGHCVTQSLELWSRKVLILKEVYTTLQNALALLFFFGAYFLSLFCLCWFLKFTSAQRSLSMWGSSLFVCFSFQIFLFGLDIARHLARLVFLLKSFPWPGSCHTFALFSDCGSPFLQFRYAHSRVRLLLNNSMGQKIRCKYSLSHTICLQGYDAPPEQAVVLIILPPVSWKAYEQPSVLASG